MWTRLNEGGKWTNKSRRQEILDSDECEPGPFGQRDGNFSPQGGRLQTIKRVEPALVKVGAEARSTDRDREIE